MSMADNNYFSARISWKLQKHLPPLNQLVKLRQEYENLFSLEQNEYGNLLGK